MLINASTKRNISGGFGANVKRAGRDILRFSALPLPCCFRRPAPIFWPANCHFQGGNNVKASLGVCFALSRNYVSSYRGTAIMRKKMHERCSQSATGGGTAQSDCMSKCMNEQGKCPD